MSLSLDNNNNSIFPWVNATKVAIQWIGKFL